VKVDLTSSVYRVIAQCVQSYFPSDHLPPFEAWQGSGLLYHWLLFSKIIILSIMAREIFLVAKKEIIPNRTLGKLLRVLGALYFGSMLLRPVAGMTFAADNDWFAGKASFFIPFGSRFICTRARPLSPHIFREMIGSAPPRYHPARAASDACFPEGASMIQSRRTIPKSQIIATFKAPGTQ
jgi:hypothetical protein